MLDPAKTQAFTLAPAGARRAVLLLHGFTGSPWEVKPLGDALAARGFHVEAPRLPGHGTTPEAMQFVTARDWLAAAERALASLFERFDDVAVAGLSMGGLLALILAARHDRVRALVLMAPVVRVADRPGQILRRLRRFRVTRVLPEWVVKHGTDIELDDVRAESPVLPRYPLARVLDLFELQDLAKRSVTRVRCPSLVLVALNDHVVDPAAVEALQRQLAGSRLVRLRRGFHIIPRDTDRALAFTEISEFLDGPALSRVA